MLYNIVEFKSVGEAVSVLNNFSNVFRFPKYEFSKGEIVKNSVAPNIFRAFQHLDTAPSIIYRQWASENFELILSDLKGVNSHSDYYKFIQRYSDSLLQRWVNETMKPDNYLMYGPAVKMVNLLIKWIQVSIEFMQEDKVRYQQVPFDSFSLRPIRLIINELINVNYKIVIPSNASMGFVNTPQLYTILMDAVYKLTKLANIEPIKYDYWCWEDKH